ncbi:hypothetical protein BBJ28_00011684 [Nothophytophthora sp. Chile5]|nr:hypothetical protein BBJ28_00011684 [Nothophytophthora sp. Chile5]
MRIRGSRRLLRALHHYAPPTKVHRPAGAGEADDEDEDEDGVRLPLTPRGPGNGDIRTLDDTFLDWSRVEGKQDAKVRDGGAMPKLDRSRRAFARRRQQFTSWNAQTASSAMKTLRECYTLARRELSTWRGRDKKLPNAVEGQEAHDSQSLRGSRQLKNSCHSAPSVEGVASSLSSSTDSEEEREKQFRRSDFSLRATPSTPSSASQQRDHQLRRGFIETDGCRERLLQIECLPVNDSEDEEDHEDLATFSSLPFRTVKIDGQRQVLLNEWI